MSEPFLYPCALGGDLVQLVPARPEDFDRLFAVASDPLIWEQHPQRHRYEGAAFRKFFDEGLATTGLLLVLDRASGAVIGSSRFYDYSPEKRWVAIGYTFLARAFWGGRYNWDLKRTMLRHAFAAVDESGRPLIDTVIFHVGEANGRSRRGVEKIGGELFDRDERVMPDGAVSLRLWYRVTRETALPLLTSRPG